MPMSRCAGKAVLSVILVAAAAGCDATTAPVVLEAGPAGPFDDYAALGNFLHWGFDREGDLIRSLARKNLHYLDEQLRILAVCGPTATPERFADEDARLAYWYNARAAWALKLAALADFPEELSDAALNHRPFPLDGQTMTLARIDQRLAENPDRRTVMAAPGINIHRARLPAEPFRAATMHQQIRRRFMEFIADENRFEIDVRHRRVRFPRVIWQYRDDFVRFYERRYGAKGVTLTTALLPLVSGSAQRRLQNAVGFACVEAPWDGRLDYRLAR